MFCLFEHFKVNISWGFLRTSVKQAQMPVLETSPQLHAAVVSDRREAAPGIVILGCHAPALARAAQPGQFAMVVPPGGERVSTALGIYEASGERISVMLVVVGPRTRELARLQPGEPLALLGPLGNGFDLAALGDDDFAGGIAIAVVTVGVLCRLARSDADHGGMKAIGHVPGDPQPVCIGPSELEMHHHG